MLTRQQVLDALERAPDRRSAVFSGQEIGDLDLSGLVFDRPVTFAGATFAGTLVLSGATFRQPVVFADCVFRGPVRTVQSRYEEGADFSCARFEQEVDFLGTVFAGRAWFWGCTFGGSAAFTEVEVSAPGKLPRGEDGQANFSWSRFQGPATFSFARFHGPVYLWRTSFGANALLDSCVFRSAVVLGGQRSEVLFPREGVVPRELVRRLEAAGLLRADTERYVIRPEGRESRFVLFDGILALEDLRERLAALELAVSPAERDALERVWLAGALPMFAPGTVVSFRGSSFEDLSAVRFEKVDLSNVTLDADVAGPPAAVEAFRAAATRNAFDAFLCHSSEDKDRIVRPLVAALRKLGVVVWYDEGGIPVGGSLTTYIDEGLARARFGVVVVSRTFFGRPWTRYELDQLVAHPGPRGPRVLPVMVDEKPTPDDVKERAPALGNARFVMALGRPIGDVALELARAMRG